jgi:DNA-binding MarR family transcriptional regulator
VIYTPLGDERFVAAIDPDPNMPSRAIGKWKFEELSDFRYALRCFLRISEENARAEGLTPLQYQLLLQVKGERRRDWVLVGELAERLQMHQHGAVALVSRCERAGWVRRVREGADKRHVHIHLTAAGEHAVQRVAARNRPELLMLSRVVKLAAAAFRNDNADAPRRRARASRLPA